jgi:hypothetical protein
LEINSQWVDMQCGIPETAPQMTGGKNEIRKFFASSVVNQLGGGAVSFNIRRNNLSNLAVMVVVLTAVVCARGQNSSDFSSLEKHVGKEVSVQTSEGQRVTGKLMRAEPSRIVVNQAGTPIPILRESVKTVTRHKNRHTAAWVAGMTGVGLGAGFLLGFSAFDDAIHSSSKVGGAALAGAGAGAAAGYGISRIGKQEQVVYESSGTGAAQNEESRH